MSCIRQRAELAEREAGESHTFDPARQALRRLPQQVPGGAAEDQDARGFCFFVGALGPYFVEAAGPIAARASSDDAAKLRDPKLVDPVATAAKVEAATDKLVAATATLSIDLKGLDERIFGQGGIRWVDLELAATLHALAAAVDEAPSPSGCSVVPTAVGVLEGKLVPRHVAVSHLDPEINACGHKYAALKKVELLAIGQLQVLYPRIIQDRDAARKATAASGSPLRSRAPRHLRPSRTY